MLPDKNDEFTKLQEKFYSATDNLKSPAYIGLLQEDLFDNRVNME